VYLKYHEGKPVIRHLERVSRPGRRHYVGTGDIPRVRNGLGMAILSTSAGVLTDRAARNRGVGGEVLALVW
jgi:small subunit ribosomal protein S8